MKVLKISQDLKNLINNLIDERINNINSNIMTVGWADRLNIQTTAEQTIISITLNKGLYLFVTNIPINYAGNSGREINTKLLLNNTLIDFTTGVCNTYVWTLARPIVKIINVTTDNSNLQLNIFSSTTSRYDIAGQSAQILRLK